MSPLREKIMALSDAQLAMLVAVAFEAINDLAARKEIAQVRDLDDIELETFGEEVVDPLLDSANEVLGFSDPDGSTAG